MNASDIPAIDDEHIDDVAELGSELYESKVRRDAERGHRGEYVAIHVDSGDFVIGRTSAEAARELLKAHPIDGRTYLRRIGDEPQDMLAARLFGSEVLGGARK